MISAANATMIALQKTLDVFGMDYVKENINCPVSQSITGDIMTISFLFEGSTQRKDLKHDYLGWCVYSTVDVNMKTASGKITDYVLPNGERMSK